MIAPYLTRDYHIIAPDLPGFGQNERNPQLAVQAAQLASATRNADLVRASRWPDLTFGVAGIQRGTRLTEYELMVEMNIPWQRDVIRANESEALAMKGMRQPKCSAIAAPNATPAAAPIAGPRLKMPSAAASCRKLRYASTVARSRSRSLLNVTE